MNREHTSPETLTELLPGDDLAGVPAEQLVVASRYAIEHRDELKEFTGKAAAQLNRDGMTWAVISKRLGVPLATIHRWAKPYM